MFINKLAIQNFRNLKSNTIEPAKLNIFVGPNNSGKSSILAALEWGLTGRNQWTDRAGRGANDLICRSAKDCQVWMDIVGLGGVVRSMPPHSLSVGKNRGIQESQADIYNHLGADEQHIRIGLNTGAFINLPLAEQKTYLFGICGIACTADKITAATELYLSRTGLPQDQAREAAARVIDLLPQGFSGDPAILEGMEKRARDERRLTKRDLERTRTTLAENQLPGLPEGLALEDKETVTGQLAELEAEKSELLKAYGARQAAEKNIALCREKAEQLAAELTRLQQAKAALEREANGSAAGGEPGGRGQSRPELAADLAREKEQLEQLVTNSVQLERELAGLLASNRNRQLVQNTLQDFDGRCPLAPGQIACRMSGQEVEELINQLAVEDQADSQQINHLQADLQTNLVAKIELQHRIDGLEQDLAALDNAERELRSLETALERAQSELAGLRQEEADWEAALRVGGAGPEAIDRLQGRIDQGRELLHRLECVEHGQLQAGQLQQALQTMEDELAVTERMVSALGPDGIRKILLGDRLDGFTGAINDMLAACTEGRYQLAWQEDFTPLITLHGQPLPLKLLSRSELLRVSIALQAAIAKWTGLSFLAVDEVDILDLDNRDLLTGSLLEVMDQFDQIMLFCTVGEVLPVNPGLPDVKMFWVEDGQVSEVGSSITSQAGPAGSAWHALQ